MDTIQSAVDAFTRLGVIVLPVRPKTKRADCAWKALASAEAGNAMHLGNAMRCEKARAIAVLLGPCSGGLAVRDFDTLASYRAWRLDHPEHASTLPTVHTARGRHVYFRLAPDVTRKPDGSLRTIEHYDDGELRMASAYVIAPPSIHENGTPYEWFVPIGPELPPVCDPFSIGLAGRDTERTESTETTENTERTESTEAVKGKGERANSKNQSGIKAFSNENQTVLLDDPALAPLIEAAIVKTLPAGPGQRHRCLWRFARELRAIVDAGTPNRLLRPVLKLWHDRALPMIRTKDFPTTWADFTDGFARVHTPAGVDAVGDALASIDPDRPPPGIVKDYPDDPGMIRLASACYALADLTPDRRFFLSARKAAGIIGMDKMTAHRWLTSLCADGYLELLERGVNRPGGKANRYRYTGPTHPDDVSASDENGTTS